MSAVYKYRIPILFAVSILVLLAGFDKIWAPYDEGFILEGSYMAGKGLVPYRDFFMLLYPPGQIYTLAALLKIFGNNLFVGRLYTVLVQGAIAVSTFAIVKKFTGPLFAFISFVLVLGSLGISEAIPRPMWPGILLSLLAALTFICFVEKDKKIFLVSSGILTGLTITFRHDIGSLTFLAVSAGIIAYSFYIKRLKDLPKLISIYALFPAVLIAALAVWLRHIGAADDAIRSLLVFPREFSSNPVSRIAFPGFCFNPLDIFHGNCVFIKNNRYYIPAITGLASAAFITLEIVRKKGLDKRTVSLVTLCFLGLFFIQQVAVRADPPHLAGAFVPSSILFGVMFSYKPGLAKTFFIAFIGFLMALYLYKNVETYYKDFIAKPFIKKTIRRVDFKYGGMYLPDDGRDAFTKLVDYVEENTGPGDRIYVGNLYHMVPQYGWNELVYFVTGRLPAVKYYEIHPGLQDREDIQEEMVGSLKKNDAPLAVLRDYGYASDLGPLDRYIRDNYKNVKTIESYEIYAKDR